MTLQRCTCPGGPLLRVVPDPNPAELFLAALADAGAALDAAHAAGYAIPPAAAQGLATCGVVAAILTGQAAERAGSPQTVAASMADAERVRSAIAPDAPAITERTTP